MAGILLKASGIWLVIVVVAIVNGIFREQLLVPLLGQGLALPLSGVLLSVLVFLVSLVFMPVIHSNAATTYIRIGALWVLLTLSFEFLFGHYVAGKSWPEIMQVFNVLQGDLFILVLLATAISPWLAAKSRGMF